MIPTTAQEAYRAMTQATGDRDARLAEQAQDDAAAEEAYLADYSDHTLAAAIVELDDAIDRLQRHRDEQRAEVQRRIEAAGGRELLVEGFRVALEQESQGYDYGVLFALREVLPEDDWAKVHKDKYEKTQLVPARFDGTQVRRVRRAYGGEIERIAKSAEQPGRVRVVVERK